MHKTQKFLIIICLVSISIIGIAPVMATGSTDSTDTGVTSLRERARTRLTDNERQTRIAELRGLNAEDRCARIQENFGLRISFYRQNHENIVTKYQEIATKVRTAINRLQAQGVDTTELEVALQQLGTMLTEINTLTESLLQTLAEAHEVACTDAAAMRQKLAEAKNILQQIRASIQTKNRYVQGQIVPLIRSLTVN